jgi:3-hydroxyacyl-CoA dehydrogenase
VDHIYRLFTGSDAGPFRNMDRVGLDVVLDIEEHYATLRPGIPEGPRDLLKSYIGMAGPQSRSRFLRRLQQVLADECNRMSVARPTKTERATPC